jgi:hypothetical protein
MQFATTSQSLVRRARRFDAQGDLIGDADAVAFEGDDFFRVIGEHANVLEAKVNEYLRADAALVLNHALASGLAVQLAAGMEMNLWQRTRLARGFDAESAAGVVEIQKHSAAFPGDGGERTRNEFGAIASSRVHRE